MMPDSIITPDTTLYITEIPAGIEGILIPYSLRSDDVIAAILICCFLITAFILGRNKKYMWQQGKNFLLHRERMSLFVSTTTIDARYALLLILSTCILTGIYFLNYFEDTQPELIRQVSPHLLLAIYIGLCLVYVIFKWALYSILGWTFFDKSYKFMWLESYSILIYYFGFAFFPLVLLFVYFDLPVSVVVIIGITILIFAKILIFYKWIKFFLINIYGVFPLILYFCALEIIPCFIMLKGMITINNFLYTKF